MSLDHEKEQALRTLSRLGIDPHRDRMRQALRYRRFARFLRDTPARQLRILTFMDWPLGIGVLAADLFGLRNHEWHSWSAYWASQATYMTFPIPARGLRIMPAHTAAQIAAGIRTRVRIWRKFPQEGA